MDQRLVISSVLVGVGALLWYTSPQQVAARRLEAIRALLHEFSEAMQRRDWE